MKRSSGGGGGGGHYCGRLQANSATIVYNFASMDSVHVELVSEFLNFVFGNWENRKM